MKSLTVFTNKIVVTGAISAGLVVLASGCCSEKKGQSAYYSSPATTANAGGSYEEQTPASQMSASSSEGNTVVPLYKESVNVGNREVDGGSVKLKKIVKTETVNQPIELRHEELVIDREPGSGATAQSQGSSQPFQEQEMEIHLKREEPVIEKQTTSNGQIVLRTHSSQEQTNITAQIRREDVDVVKFGNPQNVTINQNVMSQGSPAEGAAESPCGKSSGSNP